MAVAGPPTLISYSASRFAAPARVGCACRIQGTPGWGRKFARQRLAQRGGWNA